MKPVRLAEACQFYQDKFLPRLLHGSPGLRVFLLCLEPGQALRPRADSEEMVCCVVQGKAKLTIGGEVFEVTAGDMAGAGPGEERGVEAEERCVVLWVHVSGARRDV